MAYTYEQVFAADPSNPSNVAQNASITIFAPGDGTMTPLAITDPDGQPLANPIPVNANGFGSAFAHATLDRVAWAGGGFTGFFTSYEGMKGEAVAARAAAEAAATNAAAAAQADLEARIVAGELTGAPGLDGSNVLPTDTAIKQAIENVSSETRGALNAVFGPESADFKAAYAPFPAGRTIVCWGDSLTAGAKAEGGSYPAVLANRLKVPVLKRGFPGDNAKEISYRQGGQRLIVTVPGGTIPASGSVSVTLPSDMQVWTAADAVQGTPEGTALVGRLNGIAGKIDIVGSTATFTRTTAGQAQPVPFPLVWEDDFATTHRDAALILWTGRNNIGDFASTIAATNSMIAYSAVPRQYLVLGVTTRTDELTGQLNHTKVVDHNLALSAAYGANFLDIRRYLIDNGLADAGITATPADTTAIANDTLPPSLVADDAIHLNPIGYKLVANKVLAKIQELGWVDPADVLPAPTPVAPTVHNITVAGFTRRYLPKALSTSLLDTVITSVPDSTGTGSALAPVVTGTGATLRTSGGMTYLAFDGVNDRMNTALSQAQPYTIAMVYRMKTTGTAKALASLNNGAPSNPQFVRDATGNVYIYAGGTPTTVATPGSGTDWHFAWASVDGANTIVGVDGNVSAAATPGTAAVSGLRLGEGAGSVFTDYDVAEVLFWPTALTAGNMATVRTDVKAGHPGLP